MVIYPTAGEVVVLPPRSAPLRAHNLGFEQLELSANEKLERAANRASLKVVRFCKAFRLEKLVTLTYSEKNRSKVLGLAERHPERLLNSMRTEIGPFPYVIVPEYGEEFGALHWHLATPTSIPTDLVSSLWPHGAIDVKSLPDFDDVSRSANYLRKSFARSERPFSRRFRKASGFEPFRIKLEHVYREDSLALVEELTVDSESIKVFPWPNLFVQSRVLFEPWLTEGDSCLRAEVIDLVAQYDRSGKGLHQEM
jgi:hypothetical protein